VSDLSQLHWLQLCSPLLPVGAFAYSQALEQAAELGWIKTASELEHWLHGLLHHTIARTDLPLLACACRAWSRTDELEAQRVAQRMLALRESSELRAEEQRLGSALARVLSHLGVTRAAAFVGNPEASFVVMLALAANHWHVRLSDTLSGYAFTWLQNQVNAACRLLPIGQLDAQAITSRQLAFIPALVERATVTSDEELGVSAPGFALASAWHERQYSRLFRS
jgi:urease accessory protein